MRKVAQINIGLSESDRKKVADGLSRMLHAMQWGRGNNGHQGKV